MRQWNPTRHRTPVTGQPHRRPREDCDWHPALDRNGDRCRRAPVRRTAGAQVRASNGVGRWIGGAAHRNGVPQDRRASYAPARRGLHSRTPGVVDRHLSQAHRIVTTLYVLGSGSSGNAFAIQCDDEVLLVDAGFSARELTRRAVEAGIDLGKVCGLVLTHEHNDHTSGAARLASTLRIPILTAPGTWQRLQPRMPAARFVPLSLMGSVTHGRFRIESCRTSHDAAEPVALSVLTDGGHRIGIAYDLGRPTASVRFLLRDSHALVLEANHDDVMLRTSAYPPVVQGRIAGSTGHLSNRHAAELVTELAHAALDAVVLAHLSERCNTAALARQTVGPALAAANPYTVLHVALQECPLPPIALNRTT